LREAPRAARAAGIAKRARARRKLLERALTTVGLSRDQAFLTSVEKYFPPRNRPPTGAKIAACKPILLRQIAAGDPTSWEPRSPGSWPR